MQASDERTTAIGLHTHAREFALVARAALNASLETKAMMPLHYLWGHAIELALKAFLLQQGVPVAMLKDHRRYGHNLEALLKDAMSRDNANVLRLTPAECAAIKVINIDYRAKRFEYRERGKYSILDTALADRVVNNTVNRVGSFLRQASRKPRP